MSRLGRQDRAARGTAVFSLLVARLVGCGGDLPRQGRPAATADSNESLPAVRRLDQSGTGVFDRYYISRFCPRRLACHAPSHAYAEPQKI